MKWRYPLLLLLGIGISNIGGWIYLIALNLIILNMTGSVFSVSILYILIPVAALFTNVWAGSFIDRLNKRTLMIVLNLIRGCLIFLLPFVDSLLIIYGLVFMINMVSSIFEPASMVYMTKLVNKNDRQRFNALRNFINSAGFILGPSVAGFLFFIGTPYFAIFINALALIVTAVLILLLPDLETEGENLSEKVTAYIIIRDWHSIFRFSRSRGYVVLIYALFCGMMVFMTALDSLEAAFATTVLLLSEAGYGFLVSIAGLGMIAGSLINAVFSYKLKIRYMLMFGGVMTPAGYLLFAFSSGFTMAVAGVFFLTFALSFANTGFLTFYQSNVPADMMGRFAGIFGTIEAVMIISCTVVIGIAAEMFELRIVYAAGSFLFLVLGFIIIAAAADQRKLFYYENVENE